MVRVEEFILPDTQKLNDPGEEEKPKRKNG
jgi:hypothetical protein